MVDFFFSHIPAAGSILNATAIVVGSLAGLILHSRLPRRFTAITFQGLGLLTIFLGIFMAQRTQSFLVMAFSIVGGAITGEFFELEDRLNRLGEWTKARIRSKNEKFTEAFVASSLLFCVGSMAILGAIEEGLGGFPRLYVTKSLMDLMGSAAMAASMGVGVLFSAVPLLIYQGGMTLLAGTVQTVMTQPVVDEVSAVGGLILLGIGISILEIKKIKAINMLPALIYAGILAAVFQ
ncbi:MAG: DUF554 domain-containing protein [Synergistales bacterium]|nr:DUF554 domain-containing protein [Synergistaceae bacterium]NCC56637.1 DUF554 domain-containing protein [Synergistales bacterium]